MIYEPEKVKAVKLNTDIDKRISQKLEFQISLGAKVPSLEKRI